MIIFLNGSINAGKSTIAKILARQLIDTAIVEVDLLREMIEWMSIKEAVPLNLENAISIIKNFVKRKLNVIVPYPLSQDNYEYIVNELQDIDTQIYFFTLAPELSEVLGNRGNRELNDSERERIKHHYNIGISNPSFGVIIDNTSQTPEETVITILNNIN